MTAGGFQSYLGDELRRARDAAGLSRDDVRARLGAQITDRTLYAYERGETGISVNRFVELSQAIGVEPAAVLELALQRARMDARVLLVNLHAVLDDQRSDLAPIRQWATNHIAHDPTGVVRVSLDAISQMAVMIDCPTHTLVAYLYSFPPASAPLSQ
jgi:transcriptional regulator with XRE-family HTH domain